MRAALIAYCLGIYLVSKLPGLTIDLAILLGSLWFCLLLLALTSGIRMLIVVSVALGIGMIWHWSWGVRGLQQVLPPQLEGQDLVLQGRIVGLPTAYAGHIRFNFQPTAGQGLPAASKLQLSYYPPHSRDAPLSLPLQPGDSWRLEVRLKRPHGFANPGGYDREAYLFRHGIRATGYVRGTLDRWAEDPAGNRLLASSRNSISYWRHAMLVELDRLLIHARYPDLLVALILGERSRLDQSRWELFSATGTNHLFVISGLHVGLVTLFSFRIGSYVLRLLPWIGAAFPAQRGAALIAIAIAIAYSLLAGWGLPSQRACIMVILLLSSYVFNRAPGLSLRYLLALAFVLSLDPLAGTSMGFWFSFVAVAVLLFFNSASRTPDLPFSVKNGALLSWVGAMRPQWLVFIGLLVPLTLLLGQVSLLAPIANVIAIPVLGFLLLPTLVLACVLMPFNTLWAGYLFAAGDCFLHLLLAMLQYLAANFGQHAVLTMALPSAIGLILIVPGVILLLSPGRMPYRILAIPLLAPLLLERNPAEHSGLRVHILDVGQGLSALVTTAKHAMLFDAGPGRDAAWNAGTAVVVPALRHLRIDKLDMIIISHGDTDHAGGLAAVHAAFPAAKVIDNGSINDSYTSCSNLPGWEWDEVRFAILHPQSDHPESGESGSSNNRSCVLHVQSTDWSLLLPGDIEEPVERMLALAMPDKLQSTILVAPHHGSNTSSSYPFLKTVAAEQVVFASGYGNGFRHPAAQVVQRHLILGAAPHNTAISGMITLSPSPAGNTVEVGHYRRDHPHYWSWSGNPPHCRYC